jgi:hypothetical protein
MSFYIGFALIYNYILILKSGLPSILLLIISGFLPALYTGHIFRKLTISINKGSATSAIYSADLTGSAFGFMIISGFAVPAFGIRVSILFLSALIFAGFLFGTIRNK